MLFSYTKKNFVKIMENIIIFVGVKLSGGQSNFLGLKIFVGQNNFSWLNILENIIFFLGMKCSRGQSNFSCGKNICSAK